METAAIFRRSQISKKRRFWRIMLTSNNTFRKLTVAIGHFRYAQTFRASPGKMDTTSMRGNGTFSVPLSPSVWPGRPCPAGACSPNLVHLCHGITTI
jgi:hypothetical protein